MSTSHRINSFDALRLLGALLVIWGHGYILSGQLELLPRVGGLAVNVMGVVIFFTISGFLIYKSWYSTSSWQSFIAARFLRIVPALFVVVVLTTFVLGPLVTSASLGSYFSDGLTWRYLSNIVMLDPQYQLPGVFTAQPMSDAVNGSLWTLRAELICYAAVPLTAVLPRVTRRYVLAAAAIALIWFGLTSDVVVFDSNITMAGFYWGFFALGALAAEAKFAPRMPAMFTFIFAVVWLVFANNAMPVLNVLSLISFGALVLTVGLANIPGVRDAARFGDLSYGIYLIAFPAQQVMLMCFPALPILDSMLYVTLISAVLAWALWWSVEVRALGAKTALARWLRRLTSRPV